MPDRERDELNRQVAVMMGWSRKRKHVPDMYAWYWESPDGRMNRVVPNYTSDLNLAHEVEEEIARRGLWLDYIDALRVAVGARDRPITYEGLGKCIHASAEDKCKAALAAVGEDEDVRPLEYPARGDCPKGQTMTNAGHDNCL